MAWYKYELKPELNLKATISEARDLAKAFNDFADHLEKLEKKYEKLQESEGEKAAENCVHWIDNHNGTISCGGCNTWFHKDDRYSYMRYCPYCNAKMQEGEEKKKVESEGE